jgi:primase-polymerase (primpol)-like protein
MGRLQITHDPFRYDSLPEELTSAEPRWFFWRYEIVPGREGPQKIPYQCLNPLRASSTNERHWSRFTFALSTWKRKRQEFDGLGRVFVPSDGIVGMDLDHIWASDASDEMKPWAAQILSRFRDTYVEVSPSGNGYKLWCRGTLPEHHGLKWELSGGSKVEMYDAGRYFTVTGWSTASCSLSPHQRELDTLIRAFNHYHAPERASRVDYAGAIPPLQRHKSLVSLAGHMHAAGASDKAMLYALEDMNAGRCGSHYSTPHLEQIVRSRSNW